MISTIIDKAPMVMALLALPAYLLVFWARDMINLKVALAKGKKKGTKFIVGISADKTVRISAEKPHDKSKFIFKNESGHSQEVSIDPDDLMFAPQFGTQCAIVTQGSKKIFNPFSKDMYDPVDGEYIAMALAKAEQLGRYGDGWLKTKEQKLLVLILIATVAAALVSFAGISQVGEIATQLAQHNSAVLGLLKDIPVGL